MGEGDTIRVPVNLAAIPAGRYEVLVGTGLVESLGDLAGTAMKRPISRAMIFADANVPERFIRSAVDSLGSANVTVHTLTASEQHKSIETLGGCLSRLAETRHERTDPIIPIGGGIVGDLAGFAAATYRRGTPVVQVPTTLLAMVDASVGGKTGINIRSSSGGALLKNMAGSFHQPRLVVADLDTLDSLDAREFRCGIAECVKHGLIAGGLGDPDLFAWTAEHAERIVALDRAVLCELVSRNVALKARVVEADQFETAPSRDGGRALLNLGHTFGHAIETLPGLSPTGDPVDAPLLHGEAVSLGLVAACAAAVSAGHVGDDVLQSTTGLLGRAGLPAAVRGLPADDEVLSRMAHDKKSSHGRLRVVLPSGPCEARVIEDPDPAWLRAGIAAIRAD